jgi:transcriptional regulator with XRE-family HTH domain
MSRAELARLVGVTQPAVYNWEENDTEPRQAALSALCRVLGVTENYLIHGAGDAGAAPTPRSGDQILEDAKRDLAAVLGVPSDRIKLTFQIEA